MNSGTLAGSLIFAAVLVMLIAVLARLMMRGWRRRSERQAELLGDLPDVPAARELGHGHHPRPVRGRHAVAGLERAGHRR